MCIRDSLQRAHASGELAVDDGGWKCHELRDEQREHELGGIDAERSSVTGGHGDDRMNAVDVEEERDHEDEQHAIVRNAAHGGEQALEGEGDIV